MIGQFILFRSLMNLNRRSAAGGGLSEPEMVDNAYPNYGKRKEVARCRECNDVTCPLPNEHHKGMCESGAGNQLYHGGAYGAYRLEFLDGAVSYARLCEVCADAGGNSGNLKDLRRSWFGRLWWYKLKHR